jgi:hypothetical protein
MRMLTPILSTVEKAAQDGLREAGKAVLKLSNELAPKDDEDLVESGRVIVDDLTVQVSYTAFHARLQHENLDWQHEDGGQAKFLEAAADQVNIGTVVAEKVRAALG